MTGNGLGDGTPNWFTGVQLLVSCSDGSAGGIEIYENTIDGAAYPLALINHSAHPIRTRDVYVHDNVMTLRVSTTRVGVAAFNGLTDLFSRASNRFDSNVYRVPDPSCAYWAWNGHIYTWSQWRGLGHDVNGVLKLASNGRRNLGWRAGASLS